MRIQTFLAMTTATAAMTVASVAAAETMTIGITQNNVGVDSYQTTYEKAFIAAAEANDNVEVVVLDAGGDVARQIAQMEESDPAGSRCNHHLADKRRSGDPCGAQGASG